MKELTKAQITFLSDFKNLYGLDLTIYVALERSSRRAITVMTTKISELDIMSLERFCRFRKIRLEPNGYKALAIFVGDLV